MKKRTLCILLSISVLACLAAVKGTFAWVSFTDEIKSHMIEIGQLKYDLIGDLGSNYKNGEGKHLIVPGENLIVVPVEDESSTTQSSEATTSEGATTTQGVDTTEYEHSPLILRNYSTVDTQLRMKIEYTPNLDNLSYKINYDDASSSVINVEFPTTVNITYSGGYCYYNSTTGVIPAVQPPTEETGTTLETTTQESTTEATTTQEWYEDIVLIEDIHYKGENFDETDEGKEVSVTITIEVKQADYIDWVEFAQLELN